MAKAVNRLLSVAVLLPVILFSVAGTSFASWRCRSDGIARLSCCCPKQASADQQLAAKDAVSGAVASSLSCCEVEQHVVDKAPSDLVRGNPKGMVGAAMALPVAVFAVPPAPSPAWWLREPEPEPSPTGRLLLLRKQAFLI
jgi:hypothetical protein